MELISVAFLVPWKFYSHAWVKRLNLYTLRSMIIMLCDSFGIWVKLNVTETDSVSGSIDMVLFTSSLWSLTYITLFVSRLQCYNLRCVVTRKNSFKWLKISIGYFGTWDLSLFIIYTLYLSFSFKFIYWIHVFLFNRINYIYNYTSCLTWYEKIVKEKHLISKKQKQNKKLLCISFLIFSSCVCLCTI